MRQPDISQTLEGSKNYYVLITSDSENWKTICMLHCLHKPLEGLSREPMKNGVFDFIQRMAREANHLITEHYDKYNFKGFLFQAIIITKYN